MTEIIRSRSGPKIRPLQVAYFVSVMLVTGVIIIAAIEDAFTEVPVEHDTAEVGTTLEVEEPPPIELESLTCFTCHSIVGYRDGGDGRFPHEFHLEELEAQTCHDCHAFSDHMTPIIAENDECAFCH